MTDDKTAIPGRDLMLAALRVAADRPGGEITASVLARELAAQFRPSGKVATTIPGHDEDFLARKVHRIASDPDDPHNLVSNGYAEKYGTGIRITDAGRRLVDEAKAQNVE